MGAIRPTYEGEEEVSGSDALSRQTGGQLFAVTIDVEADDEWRSTAPPQYRGVHALPRLQALCDGYHVRPTYLVTFDVASDPESARLLRELAASERCEIGAHMHPWRTPPFYPTLDNETDYRPYLYDYPEDLQAAKMASLTHCLEDVFQRPITSHRAGRWGIDAFGCDLLEEHGYIVDTSVAPLCNWARQPGYADGSPGPNFLSAPLDPYHPSDSRVTACGTRELLEIPVSVDVVGGATLRSWRRRLVRASEVAGAPGKIGLRLLRKIRALNVVTLNPARHEQWELLALIDHLLASDRPVVNMAFHSSELVAGASPAVPTEEISIQFWERLEASFRAISSREARVSEGLTACSVLCEGKLP